MSSLPDRAESPRVPPPRRRTYGMHPGFEVALSAWMSGLTMMPAMASFVRGDWWAAGIFAFSRAERLTERLP